MSLQLKTLEQNFKSSHLEYH